MSSPFLSEVRGWAGSRRENRFNGIFCAMLFFSVLVCPLPAPAEKQQGDLTVAVSNVPPYAMKKSDGNWEGLGVQLWEQVADQLNLKFQYLEVTEAQLISALTDGRADVTVGQVAMDAEKERQVDFSNPVLSTYSRIAVKDRTLVHDWFESFLLLFNSTLLDVLLIMIAAILVMSLLIWLAEKNKGGDSFGPGLRGVGSAIWFTGVTMTTVGYGDTTPRTALGKSLSLVWMMIGLLLISAFTATVASAVTASKLQKQMIDWTDLRQVKAGTTEGSETQTYLAQERIHAKGYPSALAGLEALRKDEIEAFADDHFVLSYFIHNEDLPGIAMMHSHFLDTNVAIAMRQGFPMREQINRSVLDVIESPGWSAAMTTYLGSQ